MERRNDENEKNSWAWWSGTSFAAPIVTGTIAALLSASYKYGNPTQNEVRALIRTLYTNGIVAEEGTYALEDVMEVKQGQEPL